MHMNKAEMLNQWELLNVHVLEFLDKSDRSLAFAVFGAAQYDSFPVAVFPVSSNELLLCFDGLLTFHCLMKAVM